MARSGHQAPEPFSDASLIALAEAERRFEDRLAEARRQVAVEEQASVLELRALAERSERETRSAEEALAERLGAECDRAIAEIQATTARRVAVLRSIGDARIDRLAEGVIERLLAALGGSGSAT